MRVVFIFFHGLGALRALPSFPTRRSSDLVPAAALPAPGGAIGRRRGDLALDVSARRRGQPGISTDRAGWDHPRSEEHTSELQSRGHLVCRLLLEKKKKTPVQPIYRNCSWS